MAVFINVRIALFLAVSTADIESRHGGAWNLFMDRVRIKEGSSNVPVLGGLLDSFGGLDSRRLSTVLQTLPLPSVLSKRSLSPRPVSAVSHCPTNQPRR